VPSFWIFFLLASIVELVVGLRMKWVPFDPKDIFNVQRRSAKPALIIFGIFGILLFIAIVIVGFLKGKISLPVK